MTKIIFDWDKSRKQGIIKSEYIDNIREHFSVEDENLKFAAKRINRRFSTRKYAITKTGRFDIGLFAEIYKHINSNKVHNFKIILTGPFKEQLKTGFSIESLSKLTKSPYYYQEECVRKALSKGNGTIIVGTGGGKTLIMCLIVQTILSTNKNFQTLIIVPSIQLVEQTYKDFIEYGIDPNRLSKWSGSIEVDRNKQIIIATTSILQSKIQDISWLKQFNLVLIDECHKIRKDNKINKIFKHIQTRNVYGFTGTLPENKIDQWNIIGKIGPILYEKPASELRKENFVSNAKINIIQICYKAPFIYETTSSLHNPAARFNEEQNFIYTNNFRNSVIANLCNNTPQNTLVLVDRIAHGEELLKIVSKKAKDKKAFFICGDVEVKQRERVRQLMEKNNNVICIAITKIFSTGINIKNLHYIIFASAGKAKIKIIQSIGRGLRLHKEKSKLIILDISDDLVYSIRHLKKRIVFYKKELINFTIKKIYEKEENQ